MVARQLVKPRRAKRAEALKYFDILKYFDRICDENLKNILVLKFTSINEIDLGK